jgi:NDP-sugar pyrophosphorylase family protein
MIVIPMAGESRRFREAGFTKPKYMLPLAGRTLFAWSVGSFEHYFPSEEFLFVLLKSSGAAGFVRSEVQQLGIQKAHVVELDAPTTGQAVTVELGLKGLGPAAGGGPVTIFNIDTIRPGFRAPTEFDVGKVAGYLEVFQGPGEHWSFVEPGGGEHRVARTAEKQRISDLCCTGLYHFQSVERYHEALAGQRALEGGGLVRGEEYIAPIYNRLIETGHDVRYRVIGRSAVEFSGTPAEYHELKARWEQA